MVMDELLKSRLDVRIELITDDKAVLKRARQLLQNLEKEVLTKHACFVACQAGFEPAAELSRRQTAADFSLQRFAASRSIHYTLHVHGANAATNPAQAYGQ